MQKVRHRFQIATCALLLGFSIATGLWTVSSVWAEAPAASEPACAVTIHIDFDKGLVLSRIKNPSDIDRLLTRISKLRRMKEKTWRKEPSSPQVIEMTSKKATDCDLPKTLTVYENHWVSTQEFDDSFRYYKADPGFAPFLEKLAETNDGYYRLLKRKNALEKKHKNRKHNPR